MSVFEAVFNNPYLCREIAQWDPEVFNKLSQVSKVFAKSATRKNMAVDVVFSSGTRFWYKNGILHRDGDEPAEVWADGARYWYKDGKQHRDGDEPAVVWADGSRHWYKNGKRHRDGDEPAVVWADGTRYWYKNGVRVK